VRTLIIIALASILISGCATKVTTGSQSVAAVQLDFSGDDRKRYFLIDTNRQQIASAVPAAGKLDFQLPPDRHITECAAVLDQTGKSILDNDRLLKLSARTEYVTTLLDRQRSANQYSQEAMRRRAADAEQRGALNRLGTNRAYANGRCSRPAQLSPGPRPIVKCGSYGECFRDGKLICYSRFAGAKGCGMVASEFNIPNIVSGPTCAAVVAELAGEKYKLDDAVVDFLFGLADDAAANLRKSESAGDVILGWIVGGISGALQLQQAETCTRNFVDRQFGPLQNWLQEGERLRLEPDTLLQSCSRDVDAYLTASPVIESTKAKIDNLAQQIEKASARLSALTRERRPIEWCTR
jgi:hypothetical protein